MTGGRVTLKSYDAAVHAKVAFPGRSYRHSGGRAGLVATLDPNRPVMRRGLCGSLSQTASRVWESGYRPEPHKHNGDAHSPLTGQDRRRDGAAYPQSARGVR